MTRDERVMNLADVKKLLETTELLRYDLAIARHSILTCNGFKGRDNTAQPWLLAIIDNRILEMSERSKRYIERIEHENTPFVVATSPAHELGVIYIDGKPI